MLQTSKFQTKSNLNTISNLVNLDNFQVSTAQQKMLKGGEDIIIEDVVDQ